MLVCPFFKQPFKRIVNLVLLAAGVLLAIVLGGIDRHPVQPGRKGRFAAKCRQLSKYLEQHLLGHVFGISVAAEHAPGQVVDA
jgi:hypothetical protein